jgi:PleD family two-component response regulator
MSTGLTFEVLEALREKMDVEPIGYVAFYDGEECFCEIADTAYGQVKIWTMENINDEH